MRISDWSSDVCSSDLHPPPQQEQIVRRGGVADIADFRRRNEVDEQVRHPDLGDQIDEDRGDAEHQIAVSPQRMVLRSSAAARRVAVPSAGRLKRAITIASTTSTPATIR